ncbi:MAG TPA: hypothetical protein PLU22_23410, partial [Polyangiaceae bacterium]|nr:hypothetical protein [Polyangiaceae bacterium]
LGGSRPRVIAATRAIAARHPGPGGAAPNRPAMTVAPDHGCAGRRDRRSAAGRRAPRAGACGG